jgi:toxin ParE1/3/4
VSLPLTVGRLAEQDLLHAQEWYEEQRPGLGGEFRQQVDDLFARLAQSPTAFPVVHRNVRRVVLRRFPYLIYSVIGADGITVLACLHSGRNPRLRPTRAR